MAHRVVAVLAFVFGATVGAVLIERHHEHQAAGALWLEAGLLGAAGLLALSAHTTHITGPLTDFAGTAVRRIVGRRDLPRDRSHGLFVYGGRVLAFMAGIVTGAALSFFGSGVLLIPAVATAISAVILRRTPL